MQYLCRKKFGMKILGLGSALIDLLIRIDNDEILEQLGFPKGSMQLVDDSGYNRLSEFIAGFESVKAPGGTACNTMRALRHLKGDIGFIAKVGTDSHAYMYRKELERIGVTSYLIHDGRKPTGVATTFVSPDGERTFGTYLGASLLLNAEDLDPTVFDGYDCFYLEGYKLVNYPLVLRTAQIAKEKGIKYAIDLGSYNMVEEHIEFLKPFVREYVDILFANEEEARAYTGKEKWEALNELSRDADLCIVKLGAEGALIKKGGAAVHIPTLPITPLDTTGAGDFFSAGFLYGYSQNLPLATCGTIGNLLASHVIRYMGSNLPDEAWAEIKEQIKRI